MKKRMYLLPVLLLWAGLTLLAWCLPTRDISEAERRPLAQFPEVTGKRLLDGKFMADFEDYSLDQFPFRDGFRRIKSMFHTYVLRQKDNNGIYLAEGVAVKQEYPLNQPSVDHFLMRMNALRDSYLTDSRVFLALVPDKGYYLAEEAGQLSLDYGALEQLLEAGMPWAEKIDLTQALDAEDYYRTDTHWRQEKILPGAELLCEALGVTTPKLEDFTQTALERPFYGVYYGQAALPMEPDTIILMESPLISDCTVYDFETGKTGSVYDRNKLDSRDLYDVYLSGARSLLTIENPNGPADKELIVFRDSFGSSMIPLLLQGYGKVTVIDTRYVRSDVLEQFVDFHGQDVLLLYSTLVVNNSATLK